NGAPVMPKQLAHHFNSSPSCTLLHTNTPPTISLWPLMYLVVECTTMSAPSASGCCNTGDKKVLSTTTSACNFFANWHTARTSVICNSGLDGVSSQIIFGAALLICSAQPAC